MAAPHRQGQALGWLPSGPNGTNAFAVSAAANWYAASFVPDSARTLSAVRAYVSAITGTVGAGKITCDLYDSNASGNPGSAVESGKTTGAISAIGWYDWSSFTTTPTAGVQYWWVWKNVDAAPVTNNVQFRNITACAPNMLVGTATSRQSWGASTSNSSGGSWSTGSNRGGLRVAYADGTYDGVPASNSAVVATGDRIYSTRESGVKFTSPSNAVLKVAGLAMFVNGKLGTPTGNLRFGLWTGSSPSNLAYTPAMGSLPVSGLQWLYGYFASVQTIAAGSTVRVTGGETTNSDGSSNGYALQEITWDTDSNSVALLPFAGTPVKTYYDGSSWTDTSGSLFGFALLLDPAGEFGASGSGGARLAGPSALVSTGG